MKKPTPGAAHARLHALAGHWGGQETLHPTPWDAAGGMADSVVLNRVVLDGFAVVQDYEQYRGGRLSFGGHGIFWWDAPVSQYVLTWVDSMSGTPAEYRGDFDGDVLRLTHAMPDGGFARCSFDCGLPDEYVFVLEMSRDGQTWTPTVEGAYETVKMPGRAAPRMSAPIAPPRRALARSSARRASAKASAPNGPAAKKTAGTKTAAKKTAAKKTAAKKTAGTKKTMTKRPAKTVRKGARARK